MSFRGADGDMVFAYIVKPANFDPAKKYPVAFLIHGGPQGSFGNDFHYRWNPQTYAGARLRGGDGRLPRFDRLRPEVHRCDSQRLGRRAVRGPAEGARRGARGLSVDGRRARRRARRLVRRLHGQLDRRRLAGPLQGARVARRQPRRALRLLRDRGALVPRVGARRHAVRRTRPATPSTTRSTW